jgi:hypothetical protein
MDVIYGRDGFFYVDARTIGVIRDTKVPWGLSVVARPGFCYVTSLGGRGLRTRPMDETSRLLSVDARPIGVVRDTKVLRHTNHGTQRYDRSDSGHKGTLGLVVWMRDGLTAAFSHGFCYVT